MNNFNLILYEKNHLFGNNVALCFDFLVVWHYQSSVCRKPALKEPTAYQKDPTIRAGEAGKMVSRDAPGATALERTIIRWNFDSDPRGARIFWRVISSNSDQVKRYIGGFFELVKKD